MPRRISSSDFFAANEYFVRQAAARQRFAEAKAPISAALALPGLLWADRNSDWFRDQVLDALKRSLRDHKLGFLAPRRKPRNRSTSSSGTLTQSQMEFVRAKSASTRQLTWLLSKISCRVPDSAIIPGEKTSFKRDLQVLSLEYGIAAVSLAFARRERQRGRKDTSLGYLRRRAESCVSNGVVAVVLAKAVK